ncbi:hypothetical protein L3X38_018753 [Prunus dulcis]|uniref:Uncharacterized protein n=1 Tax=Prunus dulcis TaxID=3755 RepID=A0AAD4WC73_PRUDU|nr:hypothetical protein L3X38_018753 [Prunus dulcis]
MDPNRDFEKLLDGSDQILAIADVLLAAYKRINNHPDWYTVLQVEAHGGWRWLWVWRKDDAIFFVEAHLHHQNQDMGVLINFRGREGERKRKRSRRGHQKQYGTFTALCFSLPQPLLQVLHGGSTKVLQGTVRIVNSLNNQQLQYQYTIDFLYECGGAHCIWKAKEDGIYLFHIQTKEDKKMHDWEKIKA